jgi:hypothetical protein
VLFIVVLSVVTSTPWLGASAFPPMRDAREPGKRGSGWLQSVNGALRTARLFFGVGAARSQQILLVISDACVHQNVLGLR